MHLVAGGPKIPNTVLQAHEEGRLVFLCGAGISLSNGLPLFGGLVLQVWKTLGSASLADYQESYNAKEYDRALTHLERHYGPSAVRRAVQQILCTPNTPDTRTHEALLALGMSVNGHLRLVTTNFDLLFEAARQDVQRCSAPMLPVPKPGKWNSLVYLHGRIEKADPDGQHLVLSSADFGTAYLTERWASRFVSDLFSHFTVVFVGYSVNDPVMRYLVDAIAADRKREGNFHPQEAFAFAPLVQGDDPKSLEAEWTGKNVTPIPYTVTLSPDGKEQDHGLLHDTIREWARLWRGGIGSRKNVAYELGRKNPRGLSDEERSRLLWAISDPVVARHFADLGTEAPLDWLEVLEPAGVITNVVSEGDNVSLVNGGHSNRQPPRLPAVTYQLGRWLAAHTGNPDLLRWVINRGGHLHPHFAALISPEKSGDAALEKVWRVLLSPDILARPDDFLHEEWFVPARIVQDPWTPGLRQAFLRAMAPAISLGRSLTSDFGVLDFDDLDEADANVGESSDDETVRDDAPPLRVSDVTWVDCEVRAGHRAREIVTALRARDHVQEILSDLAMDLTVILRQALDLFASLDEAGPDHDPSSTQQPSIASHEQNYHHDEWVWLIEACRDSFDALLDTDRNRAERFLDEWAAIQYPVFRRLTMYGVNRLIETKDDA